MRTQQPHVVPAADLPDSDGPAGAGFTGRGLCCPDDPLDLVLRLFPADRAPPPSSSLAALGIGGGGGEPPRWVNPGPEPEPPQPLAAESAYGGGGWDSWGLSSTSLLLNGLCGLEEIDVDMFFADDELGGGFEKTEGNLLCDPTEAQPKPPAHMAGHGGGPVHVHTRGSLGGAVVPNGDASPLPLPAPMQAGAFPLHPYDACRAAFVNNAPPPPLMPAAAGPPPVFITNNSAPPLPALMPSAPAPMPPAAGPPPVFITNNSARLVPAAPPAPVPAGGSPPAVTHNSTPPLPALIMPASPARMPLAPPAPMPAAPARMPPAPPAHACGSLLGIVSNGAPVPQARPLYPNAAAPAGVYSITNAPAHAPPSAAPSSSPPSRHAWVVPRKQRTPPSVNRRKRPWLLDYPLRALPPAALPPPANPSAGGDDDDDAKNRVPVPVLVVPPPPPGNTNTGGDDSAGSGGGIRRRHPTRRQRNRQAERVCSHCRSLETPQWRAGPDGAGTLCNACGIRYAARRLLPEYRPSTAPSFRRGQHSNRHRKVMKLRQQMMVNKAKEEEEPSSEQQRTKEDGRKENDGDDDDGGFMGVSAYTSAAGL